ncbi:MAG TPA: hypothetical protein PKE65_03005, partial [Rhizobiaceae bacterium]|nr:hypothetical protein [Rhizobiaceae bacterium]
DQPGIDHAGEEPAVHEQRFPALVCRVKLHIHQAVSPCIARLEYGNKGKGERAKERAAWEAPLEFAPD